MVDAALQAAQFAALSGIPGHAAAPQLVSLRSFAPASGPARGAGAGGSARNAPGSACAAGAAARLLGGDDSGGAVLSGHSFSALAAASTSAAITAAVACETNFMYETVLAADVCEAGEAPADRLVVPAGQRLRHRLRLQKASGAASAAALPGAPAAHASLAALQLLQQATAAAGDHVTQANLTPNFLCACSLVPWSLGRTTVRTLHTF